MRKFTDNKQNQWAININVGTVLDVQEELGINLLDPTAQIDDVPLPAKFLTDDLFLAKLVACVIGDQLAKNNISKDEFYDNLDALALQSMSDAFIEEYKAFFMSRGRKNVAMGIEEMQTSLKEMYDIPQVQSTNKSEEADSQSQNAED